MEGPRAFSLLHTPSPPRVTALPIILSDHMVTTLENLINRGEKNGVTLQFTGDGAGVISIQNNSDSLSNFSFNLANTSPITVLKENGKSLVPLKSTSTECLKITDHKVIGPTNVQTVKRDHNVKKEIIEDTKKLPETTPESGYGTGTYNRLFESDDEEKQEDVNELSATTPYTNTKSRLWKPVDQFGKNTKNNDSDNCKHPTKSVNYSSPHKRKIPLQEIEIKRARLMQYPNVDKSFLAKYPPIQSRKDRLAYNMLFNRSYKDYLRIHKKLTERCNGWDRLNSDQTPKTTLVRERMNQLTLEGRKDKDVPEFKYMHEKLTHLKRLCAEWDLRRR